ncbi:ASCH domain-containing protein [Candidatus Gracilibacteria bacterium]|nr:ASCH domain-containing protein [Candidatus Gracilibacteria bacterium]
MNTIFFNVQEPYKSQILSGQKTVEGRLNKGKFGALKIGDYLQFEESGEKLKVVNLTSYTSFQSMLENEGLKHVLPGVREVEQGVAVYRKFYSIEQEKEFGVIAIEMKKEE